MSRILKGLSLIAFSFLIIGAPVAPSFADGASDIKDRQAFMKSMGGKMKAMGQILKDGGDAGTLAGHANELASLAKKLGSHFPAGSGMEAGETRAKANIWTDRANFDKVVAQLVAATDNLAKAAAGGDLKATGGAMGMAGKNGCGTCHKTYREKKKE